MHSRTHTHTHALIHLCCKLKSRLNQAESVEIPVQPNADSTCTFKEEVSKETGKKSTSPFNPIVSVAKKKKKKGQK